MLRLRPAAGALALLLAVGAGPSANAGEKAPRPPADTRAVGAAITAFACDLHGAVASQEGNLIHSPLSVYLALAMVREGAEAQTRAALDRLLRAGEGDLAARLAELAEALRPPPVRAGEARGATQPPAYEFRLANRLWCQRGYAFEPAFLAVLEQTYRAPLAIEDFSVPEPVRQRINAWAARETRERIRDLVPRGALSPETRLVLANALYLKAAWSERFYEGATKVGEFAAPDGPRRVPFLAAERDLRYGEGGGVRWVALPYRGPLEMRVYLPTGPGGLPDLERALGTALSAAGEGASRRIDLKLPRFTVRRAFDLSRALRALGLEAAFDPNRAEFGGITRSERLFIGAVAHQGYVAVDEEGTEAAAATAMPAVGEAAGPADRPLPFHADRPFLFTIRHVPSGAVLFVGRVSDPAAEGPAR